MIAAKSNENCTAEGIREIIADVKKRGSLSYAIKACEDLGRLVVTMHETIDIKAKSPYENVLEHMAIQHILKEHHISRYEIDVIKNAIDVIVTETLA